MGERTWWTRRCRSICRAAASGTRARSRRARCGGCSGGSVDGERDHTALPRARRTEPVRYPLPGKTHDEGRQVMAKKDEYYVVATENHRGGKSMWAADARDLKDAERIKGSVEK